MVRIILFTALLVVVVGCARATSPTVIYTTIEPSTYPALITEINKNIVHFGEFTGAQLVEIFCARDKKTSVNTNEISGKFKIGNQEKQAVLKYTTTASYKYQNVQYDKENTTCP